MALQWYRRGLRPRNYCFLPIESLTLSTNPLSWRGSEESALWGAGGWGGELSISTATVCNGRTGKTGEGATT